MPRVIAAIQARMGSQRLPGKMMKEAAGVPLLGHLIERVRQVKGIDGTVVATSASPANDVIEAYCKKVGVSCHRGEEDDVLSRMIAAFTAENADIGIHVYGDGPLVDPKIIEECLKEYQKGGYDWVGNDRKATYPSGMYGEVFGIDTLRDSGNGTDDPAIREHATLFIRKHPELYKQKNIEAPTALSRPDIHLDVDTEEDFAVFMAIIEHFKPRNDFSLADILAFLDTRPEIAQGNKNVERRWKQHQRQ